MCAGAGAASEAPEAPLQRKPLETSRETATRPRHDHGGRRDPRGSGTPLFSLITLGRCLGEEPRTRSRPSSTFPGPAHLAEPRLVCHAPGPTNGAPLPAPGHEKPCCPAPLPRPGCAGSLPALLPEANPPLDLPTNPARGHFCSPIQNVRLSQPGPALPPANEPTRLSGPNTMNQDPRPGRTCHHVSPSRLSLDPAVSWLRFSPRTIYRATVSWLPSPPPTTRPPSRGPRPRARLESAPTAAPSFSSSASAGRLLRPRSEVTVGTALPPAPASSAIKWILLVGPGAQRLSDLLAPHGTRSAMEGETGSFWPPKC